MAWTRRHSSRVDSVTGLPIADSGALHHDVELAERVDGRRQGGDPLVLAGDVERHEDAADLLGDRAAGRPR